MACTSVSAVEYVKNARVLLVGGLRSLSVIVENLYQQRVLSDEEVSKINAEKDDYDKTRKILDLVTNKGEAATYEFLKIIDITRKRTLPPLLSKNKPDSSSETEKSDLHQWISSFPFKADRLADEKYFKGAKPCHKYQRKLKEKAQKISKKFWSGNKDVFGGNKKPDLSYTSLVLDKEECEEPLKIKRFKSKESKMRRPKKLKTYIPENKGEMSPCVLLKTHKNILLVGKPGIGKTAVICEMLRLWAESENEELDYMFYFDMREVTQMKIMTLEDLLFNAYIKPDEGKDEVLQDIERISDNVTVMLDGVTDLSSPVLKKLLEGDLLPGAKIIIACRPDDEEDTCLDDHLRVEVKGFSEQAINAYLSATLADEHKTVLINVELLTLCHVPMYALMVAASCSSGVSPQPRTVTEVYIHIVRFCLQRNRKKKKSNTHLNNFIKTKSEGILSLAKAAFLATQGKTVNLEEVSSGDSCVLSFLKPLIVRVSPTKTLVKYAFLHYTVQEFFAALWLLKNPDQIKNIIQQRPNDEMKHMTHLIPFICRLLNEENPSLISCLIPAQELQNTRTWFFKEIIASFSPDDVLFLCQCLYESQLPEACIDLLDKLDYCLDLSDQNLDPYHCCAVAYVISQSKKKKIQLQLEDVVVSEQGMEQLLRCLKNVHRCEPLSQQLWKIFLQSDRQMDPARLLSLDRNQLHLPVHGERRLFGRAVEVINKMPAKVKVCLYGEEEATVCQCLCESLFPALPNISSLSVLLQSSKPLEEIRILGNLFCAAAEREQQTGEKILQQLSSVCRYREGLLQEKRCDFLLDLYEYMTTTSSSVPPSLLPVLQSGPAVWSINLSKRKTSILLEVLKLQPEKKQVMLTGWTQEDVDMRNLLQCLPLISELSLDPWSSDLHGGIRFLGNLFCAAAEREQQTGEKILQQLSSVCRYRSFIFSTGYKAGGYDMLDCDLPLDLYTHMKDYETKTGFRVLPSLRTVFQSAPAVWIINLSERKTSILLEVLKLQSEKKPVELRGCSHEDGEVRSFLQCLPYISQLSLYPDQSNLHEEIRFLGNLFCAAAEREQQTGEKILQQLSSVCRYETFPFSEGNEDQYDVLLDLYTHMKDCETQTGFRILPSFQSVFQSAPAVWIIDLSKRKTSILLEVLKLQSEKKPVELTGCSHEDGEVRSFLQCLPYISQLSLDSDGSDLHDRIRFLGNLFCAAAEREQQTGEKILQQLSSVCRYETFPFEGYVHEEQQCDVLLDLYTHMKDCETQTGFRVLPSLRSVFQSAPAVWIIDLSKRKTSILLEALKLQSEKKPVELTGCSHEEGEVRSFLQCLPYISQLSLDGWRSDHHEGIKFLGNLFCAAAEREQQTGEKILQQLSSVCRYETFPCNKRYVDGKHRCDLLLDLYIHVKETKTGFRVFPSLRSVFQSAPAVWIINLSERKTSILLEVLKLQSEKKPVKLTGCSHEDGEVRSFLQCLPYISKLRLSEENFQQVLDLLLEIPDQELMLSRSRFDVDLTWCRLTWDLLHHLLQKSSSQTIIVDLKTNRFLQQNHGRLLPFLDQIVFKRPGPVFTRTFIRELYRARARHMIPSLLRSLDHVISLSCTELDLLDCDGLLFILQHSDVVKLNLMWASIPTERTESIFLRLDRVSHLSVDRNQLLGFIRCCAASSSQQEAASGLLRTLQHKLDLSWSSCVALSEDDQAEPSGLTDGDCRAISTILRCSTQDTQLLLSDWQVKDSGLDLLFPVLDRVRLSVSKPLLLQLLSLVPVNRETDTERRAEFLSRSLGGELDLSHSTLDQRLCAVLNQMLDICEDLTELDLSHCQLTDHLLSLLITQLHKVHVLDLSHNLISDASTDVLLRLVSINPSISSVRLFNNNITNMTAFRRHQQFEIW
ncbi:uncharacterized protein LOC133425228 [Cololabis saira]|uniref:uncharacterized protein LOC133425228 n=1 Tax=Cololabis saira TaxID=129043 RepID=UPI002AD5840D|nr:uncharacterized protein LOC133425228 [Cololabis saira]XP_061571946.1 uncharacterized protein LOC133425228 [Cololabis saira]